MLIGLDLHCVVPTSEFIYLSLSAYVFSIYFPTTTHDMIQLGIYILVCDSGSVNISIRCKIYILLLYIIHTYFCSSEAFYFQLQYTQDFFCTCNISIIINLITIYFVCKMARTKCWARKSTGGKTPRKQLVRTIFVCVYM
jgi:hypothetical protein